jgi:capsular polysaccharide biosynthesis protein
VELRRYLGILRRRILLIAATVAVAVGAAWAATPRTPHYVTTAVVYVGPRAYALNPAGPANNSDVLQGINGVLATFTRMIDSRPIAAQAVSSSGVNRSPEAVVAATAASVEPGTQLLDIQVMDTDPGVSQRLANGLADAFVNRVQSTEPTTGAGPGTAPAVPAYVFQRASPPTSPESTGLTRNVALAALFALVLSAGVAFLLEYLDLTIKGVVDAEQKLELPVLGIIPMKTSGP